MQRETQRRRDPPKDRENAPHLAQSRRKKEHAHAEQRRKRDRCRKVYLLIHPQAGQCLPFRRQKRRKAHQRKAHCRRDQHRQYAKANRCFSWKAADFCSKSPHCRPAPPQGADVRRFPFPPPFFSVPKVPLAFFVLPRSLPLSALQSSYIPPENSVLRRRCGSGRRCRGGCRGI